MSRGNGIARVICTKVERMDMEEHLMRNGRCSDLFSDCTDYALKKVYCCCGRIVDLDSGYFARRIQLGKPVECFHCRNLRISREIDELNDIFSGVKSEESGFAAF